MRRIGPLAVVLLTLFALTPAGPALAAGPRTYVPPFEAGPQGGDQFNYVSEDAAQGRVTVFRANPQPGSFNCAGGAGYADLRVSHVIGREGIGRVDVDFADAVWDGYTFVSVHVATVAGRWLGFTTLRGPVALSGTISVPVHARVRAGTAVRITFGIATSSACPSLGGGMVRFTRVRVQPRGVR